MVADIATANTGWADVLFLVAVVLACVAAVLAWRPAPGDRFAGPALSLAVAAAALAWLVL
jgi:hypothetical protein